MSGRFTDGHGVFYGTDVVAGREVMLRFDWRADPLTPVWQQAFSEDGGVSWKVNWVMTLRREGEEEPA